MTATTLHLIDAFADGPFTGNPAAVMLLADQLSDQWMQSVAMEMNQAETAFLRLIDDGFSLRWFTPRREVDLCGHATLASAHFLWTEELLSRQDVARFHTRSGLLTAAAGDDDGITLDFPAIVSSPVAPPANLEAVLGANPGSVLQGDFDLLCVLENANDVRRLTPDLAAIANWNVRGLIVTARGDMPGLDFVSRCFFPAFGIPEDPVTGSAHCALAPYWHGVTGRETLVGRQLSARGGTVHCQLHDGRVRLTGKAVTTLTGVFAA